ncbi:MAG: metal-dependent hydrolase [Deltaproteobacteria bacterium]|nr:metal-dependent hydrolase [Deltaproteobacteria bacterium]
MFLSHDLLTAAIGLMMVVLLRSHLNWAARLGPRPFLWLALGVILPLADYPLGLALTGNQADMILGPLPFHSLFYSAGILGMGGLVVFLWNESRFPWPQVITTAAGLLGHQLLMLTTPQGLPWLAPFSTQPISLPLHPDGHPALALLLGLILVLLEGFPHAWENLLRGAAALTALYLLAGLGGYSLAWAHTRDWYPPQTQIDLEPATPLLTRWRVTATLEQTYSSGFYTLGNPQAPAPEERERWNNAPLLNTLLGNRVVSGFYYRVFKHPLARVETTEGKLTLMMEELPSLGDTRTRAVLFWESNEEGNGGAVFTENLLGDFIP